MTPRYPGARFYGGTNNGNACNPEGVSWHEYVNTVDVDRIMGWGQQAKSFHLAIGQFGDCGQGCEFNQAVNGTKDGNGRMITVETWDDLDPNPHNGFPGGTSPDGSHGPNDFRWTPQQCERAADIAAFFEIEYGIPIRRMMNTREDGHAPHRLGVPSATGNVRVGYGPDQWTMHPGKECPGDLRILQLFGPNLDGGAGSILARARVIAAHVRAGGSYLPTGNVNLTTALARGASQPEPFDLLRWIADPAYVG